MGQIGDAGDRQGVFPAIRDRLFRGAAARIEYTAEERKLLRSGLKIGMWVLLAAGLGDIALWGAAHGIAFAHVSGATPPERAAEVLAAAATASGLFWADFLAASAAAAVGALVGFLLGIPRALIETSSKVLPAGGAVAAVNGDPAQANVDRLPENAGAGPAPQPARAELGANTNLEQISDKLTFLIIGATLVQSQNIISWIEKAGDLVRLDNAHLVPVALVYFFALGFLGMYLSTRLFITFAFSLTLPLLSGAVGNSQQVKAG